MTSFASEVLEAGTRHSAWRGGRRLGSIDVRVDADLMNIVFIEVFDRGQGVGTLLLDWAVEQARRSGVRRLALDDVSDRFGRHNNLYLKAGFRYVEDGYPEMIKDL
jgi:GNAT superfamily N-acetyltransferase